MRQITFELIRHGPPNNQLLSPLTAYLALCENHAAITVHVPFEHNQFLHRLRALSYQLGDESRTFQVRDTARVLGDILAQVPGLLAELNRDDCPGGSRNANSQNLIHLRMIISASELALLPFELALAPPGFPDAGQSLLLQFQSPICLTREVRRVTREVQEWPANPRILFVAAAPADVDPVPVETHLAILKRLLEPWIGYADSDEERNRRLEEHLVVLTEATCDDIERACAEGSFSHVHILAHGVTFQEGFDIRFGLALHDPMNPAGAADRVSGDRLATALRAVQGSGVGPLASPLVVTLASCESASQGDVAGAGGSIAHALHAAGVPVVIASQFPISVAGSVLFVEVLYKALLWGEDPRMALNDLRRRLYTRFRTTHDWASVSGYISLPSDFDRRMSEVQISQTMRNIEVAMNYADRATAKLMRSRSSTPAEQGTTTTEDQKIALLNDAGARIEAGKKRLERLLDRHQDQRARVFGLLAATEKRCAEVYFSFTRVTRDLAGSGRRDWQQLLFEAHQHYWETFALNRDNSWGVVQYLSLDIVLRNLLQPEPHLRIEGFEEHNRPANLWKLAEVLSVNDLRTKDEQRVRWAFGNLTELYLIAPMIMAVPPEEVQPFADRAVQKAQDLVDRAGADSFEVYSTRRQVLRYEDWYAEIAQIPQLEGTVERILAVLPAPKRNTQTDYTGS